MKCFQVTLFSLMLCLFEYNFARKSVILGLVKFGLKLQVDRVIMAEFPVPGIFGFFSLLVSVLKHITEIKSNLLI